MASEWGPADWAEVGAVRGVLPNGGDLEVHVRRDGLAVLDLDGEEVELSPAERDKLRELLDRAAMPGQEPPAMSDEELRDELADAASAARASRDAREAWNDPDGEA